MESYASNEPRIGIVKTAMGACAQFAVFTYAEMRRTPRYEIRVAAFFADNLMNSVVHCGWQFQIHERPQQTEHPSTVGIAAFIIAYVTKCLVIYIFSLLSPGSFRQAGRNLHFFSVEPRRFPTSGA